MSRKSRSLWGVVTSSIVSFVILTVAVLILINRQIITDTITAWQFTPSQAVSSIADRTGMTEEGRRLFYASRPQVLSGEEFNAACPRREQKSPILGCYTFNGEIFVFDITNSKLDGIEEVTAVHEMLHAAWSRLDRSEKEEVTALLTSEYAAIEDAELQSRIEYYERTEPGQFANELHSILATERSTLSSELEAYFTRYFDRTLVLGYYNNYKSTYTELTDEAEALRSSIKGFAQNIEERSKVFRAESEQLSHDIRDFNQRANTGMFSSIAQFNRERSSLLARSSSLEAIRSQVNQDIVQYNAAVQQYEEVAKELQSLNDSIDSLRSLDSAPSI